MPNHTLYDVKYKQISKDEPMSDIFAALDVNPIN